MSKVPTTLVVDTRQVAAFLAELNLLDGDRRPFCTVADAWQVACELCRPIGDAVLDRHLANVLEVVLLLLVVASRHSLGDIVQVE